MNKVDGSAGKLVRGSYSGANSRSIYSSIYVDLIRIDMTQKNEDQVMFAVMVKTEARSDVCEDGKFWVKDETHEYYVTEKDRGLWKSKDDAEKAITESWEEIVEVKKKKRRANNTGTKN